MAQAYHTTENSDDPEFTWNPRAPSKTATPHIDAQDTPPPALVMQVLDFAEELVAMCVWPRSADASRMNAISRAFDDLANVVDDVTGIATKHAQDVADHNDGEAIKAFGESFARLAQNGRGDLVDATVACRALAGYSHLFATEIKSVKTQCVSAGTFLVGLWIVARVMAATPYGAPYQLVALAETPLGRHVARAPAGRHPHPGGHRRRHVRRRAQPGRPDRTRPLRTPGRRRLGRTRHHHRGRLRRRRCHGDGPSLPGHRQERTRGVPVQHGPRPDRHQHCTRRRPCAAPVRTSSPAATAASGWSARGGWPSAGSAAWSSPAGPARARTPCGSSTRYARAAPRSRSSAATSPNRAWPSSWSPPPAATAYGYAA
jgi:hypothetical protein